MINVLTNTENRPGLFRRKINIPCVHYKYNPDNWFHMANSDQKLNSYTMYLLGHQALDDYRTQVSRNSWRHIFIKTKN
jgi:hypothetical protein